MASRNLGEFPLFPPPQKRTVFSFFLIQGVRGELLITAQWLPCSGPTEGGNPVPPGGDIWEGPAEASLLQ